MGKTISVNVCFDKANVRAGKATISDKQASFLNRSSLRLSKGLTYVMPRQWVHVESLVKPFKGFDSKKAVYIFGYDHLNHLVEVQSIGYNGLLARHYGTKENPIELELEQRDGRWLPIGSVGESVFKEGVPPFKTNDSNEVYVSRDFTFKLVDRKLVRMIKWTNSNGSWECEQEEGDPVFENISLNIYQETDPIEIDTNFSEVTERPDLFQF